MITKKERGIKLPKRGQGNSLLPAKKRGDLTEGKEKWKNLRKQVA